MSETLKKCPFCGGKASVFFHTSEGTYTVECCECFAMVGRDVETYDTRGRIFFESKVEAIEAWNRRGRMKIICPKCGEVKQYRSVEYVRHTLTLDERNEVVDCTEDYCIKQGKPRCVKCGRMVKLTEQEGEGWNE